MITFSYPDPQNSQVTIDDVIKCGDYHQTLIKERGELITQRTNFWGVSGASEIVSAIAPEPIVIECWLNDVTFVPGSAGADQLIAYLKYLDGLRGYHGVLAQGGAQLQIHNTYQNVTFEGFQPSVLPGQNYPDLVTDCCGNWFLAGTLHWTTLRAHS